MHKPIQIKDYSLFLTHKTCFENFNTEIHFGNHIAIIGRNGSGKSTLLKMIKDQIQNDFVVGYIPQIIENHTNLSGGQRFNTAFTEAIALNPDILLLDEPTNHLDLKNRKSLLRHLESFYGTVIIASHDTKILTQVARTFWHINNGKIHIFSGQFDDYIKSIKQEQIAIQAELSSIKLAKKATHEALMQEQRRAAKSAAHGSKSIENCKWSPIISNTKASRAQETSARKKSAIQSKKKTLIDKLSNIHITEIIQPKFALIPGYMPDRIVASVSNGSIGYRDKVIAHNIHFNLLSHEHLAIIGNNGSGKSTLAKAIIGDHSVIKSGNWILPKYENIGYLDQHYSHLSVDSTPIMLITNLLPDALYTEVRRHLTQPQPAEAGWLMI